MNKTYITLQGDMWDSISHNQLGHSKYKDILMAVNSTYIDYYIFPAGITLTLPDVDTDTVDTSPPWKQVVG